MSLHVNTRLLLLTLAFFSLFHATLSSFDGLSRSIETLDDFDLQIAQLESLYNSSALHSLIALSSLYHIREERWNRGGDWEAVRYATEARVLLRSQMAFTDHHSCSTQPSKDSTQLQDVDLLLLVVVHEVRLLAAIGRYDEAVSLATDQIKEHEQLCGQEDHALTPYAMERRGLVIYTLGESLLAAGRGLEAVPHLARAMRLRPCLLNVPHRLALALTEAARDGASGFYDKEIRNLISATTYRLLHLIPAASTLTSPVQNGGDDEQLHAPRLNLTAVLNFQTSVTSTTDLSLQPLISSSICELGDELNYQIALMQAAHLVSVSSSNFIEINITKSDVNKQAVLKMALTPVRSQHDIGAEEHLAAARSSLHWALHACYEALSKLKSASVDEKEGNQQLSWFHLQQARHMERVARHRPLLPSLQSLVKPEDGPTVIRTDEVENEDDTYSHRKSVQGVRKIETNYDPDYWPRTINPLLNYNQSLLPRPLFIVGFFRSGSTLLESLLDAHPNIWGLGEQSSFASALPKLKQVMLTLASSLEVEQSQQGEAKREESMDGRVAKQLHKHGKAVLLEMQRRCHVAMNIKPDINQEEVTEKCSGVLVDKMLGNYRNVGLLHLVFPKNALIVHTLRDPIDTLLSCMKARLGENAIYTLDSRSLAEEYALYLRSVRHWQKILPINLFSIFRPGNDSVVTIPKTKNIAEDDKVVRRQGMITVRYDQLIAAPLATVNQILSFMQLPPLTEEQLSVFNQRQRLVRTASFLQARQPVYNSSVGGWLRHRQELRQFLVPALKEALQRHGLWDELVEIRSSKNKKKRKKSRSEQQIGTMNWAGDESFDYNQLLQALAAHAAPAT